MFSRKVVTLDIDRKRAVQARLQAEAARIDAETAEMNKRAQAAAVAEYEAEKAAWEANPEKPVPFTVQDGLLINREHYVLIRAIDSFHWACGTAPMEDFRFSSFDLRLLVAQEDGSFKNCPHYLADLDRPYAFLRERKHRYYPNDACLKVNAAGDNRLTICCPEYARQWVHQRFLEAIRPEAAA